MRFLSTPSVRRATYWFLTDNGFARFLSTPSVRRATVKRTHGGGKLEFLSTPSVRRATVWLVQAAFEHRISIHALRAEGDDPGSLPCHCYRNFYPRPPCGGRRGGRFFSFCKSRISIHALRAEGDACNSPAGVCQNDFYPRPPCGGRPASHKPGAVRFPISIHALRAEGDLTVCPTAKMYLISIHALRAEGDRSRITTMSLLPEFLSTPSVRRATVLTLLLHQGPLYFYPRPPCGGRRDILCRPLESNQFLSTPSVRRATPAQWRF